MLKHQFGSFLNAAWNKAPTIRNGTSGFSATGIYSYSLQAIPQHAFAISDSSSNDTAVASTSGTCDMPTPADQRKLEKVGKGKKKTNNKKPSKKPKKKRRVSLTFSSEEILLDISGDSFDEDNSDRWDSDLEFVPVWEGCQKQSGCLQFTVRHGIVLMEYRVECALQQGQYHRLHNLCHVTISSQMTFIVYHSRSVIKHTPPQAMITGVGPI
ncbi:hypothetical protein TNCV_1794991 [Trichonephila clavipes]|nr:hypothetical protein TNCV_1794991 [Trichonephila clavipes]